MNYLITLEQKYIKELILGTKIMELRTRIPQDMEQGDTLFVAKKGSHNRLSIKMTVSDIIVGSPSYIYRHYFQYLGMSEVDYFNYTAGRKQVYAIFVSDVIPFQDVIYTSYLGVEKAPQWFTKLY